MRFSDLRFLLAWLLPLLTLYGTVHAPTQVALWTLGLWLFIAAVDACIPGVKRSPSPVAGPSAPAYFRWVLRGYVPLQLLLIAVGAQAALQAEWWTLLGVGFSVGFITGSQGITFAHELGHSKSKLDRLCAWILMSSVCYGHFMVEHYRGHHPRAATFDDPASARRGESLYRFLPRTLWGSLTSGWRLEAQRLAQFRSSWLRSPLAWSALGSLMPFVLAAVFFPAAAAAKVMAFFAIQSAVAFLLLEVINYIEHYGLQRAQQTGRHEPFGLMHAWNADHFMTNSMLANLQRHSDHHMHAWKPYPSLAALPGPQLPTGYAGCLALAMVPPLWFALMHKRLDALQSGAAAA